MGLPPGLTALSRRALAPLLAVAAVFSLGGAAALGPEAGAAPSSSPPPGCASVESVARRAAGGRTAGLLFLPEGTGPFPAVVAVHGGFADDPRRATQATRDVGAAYAARLCPLGFAVFSVDYRWSPFGGEEMLDVSGAFDLLAGRAEIDADRIAVMGASHGGYMATYAVTAPDPAKRRPFAAAVNLFGFVDVAAVAERKPGNPQVRRTVAELGRPGENPAAYRAISPRYQLQRLRTPLLVVVGTRDQLLGQLRDLRRALARAGKAFEYHEVPGAAHGFDRGSGPTTEALWGFVVDFLERELA